MIAAVEVGDRVMHAENGAGTVQGVTSEGDINVLFDGQEIHDAALAEDLRPVQPPAGSPKLAWALYHIKDGAWVFPVKIDKSPLTEHGFEDSTNDPNVARAMWAKHPDANIACDLGRSNRVVADYDYLEVCAPPQPATTMRVQTGRGIQDVYSGKVKTHSIFVEAVEPFTFEEIADPRTKKINKIQYDARGLKVSKSKIAVGEVRSEGSYVVMPGSQHKSGKIYTLENDLPLASYPYPDKEEVCDSGSAIGTDKQNEIAGFVAAAFDAAKIDYKAPVPYSGGFKWLIDCPQAYLHTGHKGIKDGGSSSAVIMLPSGALSYKCQHAHCEEFQWADLRANMEEVAGKKLQFGPTGIVTVTPLGAQAYAQNSDQSAGEEESVPSEKAKDWTEAPDITSRPGEKIEFHHQQTDMGRLTRQLYGKDFTFSSIGEKGWWMWFNGKIWTDCHKSRIRELIRKAGGYISSKILPEIVGEDEATLARRKWFSKLVSSCNDTTFAEKVMTWMQEDTTRPEDFDSKPMLFNFNNGTYDFETSEFRKFNSADCLTQISPVNYNPDALCQTFDEMLENMFDNPEMRAFIIRYMGYCMLGCSPEKSFLLVHGNGDNGKTILAELLKAILGNYAQCAEWDSFSVNRSGSIRNDIACLWNARFVYCDEGEHDVKIAAGKLKAMSGSGSMKARFLNKEFFTFLIKFKMMLIANIRPQLPAADQALWSRVLDVHLKRDYRKGHPNRIEKLKAKLWEEREGITAKMLKGAHEFLRDGLNPPDEIRVSTESYRNAIDPLQSFFQTCCVFQPDSFTSKQDLYKAYESFCFFNKEKYVMAETMLAERLRSMSIEESRTHNPRGWSGIRLIQDGRPKREFDIGTSPQQEMYPGGSPRSDDTPVAC